MWTWWNNLHYRWFISDVQMIWMQKVSTECNRHVLRKLKFSLKEMHRRRTDAPEWHVTRQNDRCFKYFCCFAGFRKGALIDTSPSTARTELTYESTFTTIYARAIDVYDRDLRGGEQKIDIRITHSPAAMFIGPFQKRVASSCDFVAPTTTPWLSRPKAYRRLTALSRYFVLVRRLRAVSSESYCGSLWL